MARMWGWWVVVTCVGCSTAGADDWCSGVYSCPSGASAFEVRPQRNGERCLFDGWTLEPDGTAVPPVGDAAAAWGFSPDGELAICAGGSCRACLQLEGEIRPEDGSTGRCTGSPRSCDSVSPGSCSAVDGCYLDLGSIDDSWDDECAGSPRSCGGYTSQSSCTRQGCDWED